MGVTQYPTAHPQVPSADWVVIMGPYYSVCTSMRNKTKEYKKYIHCIVLEFSLTFAFVPQHRNRNDNFLILRSAKDHMMQFVKKSFLCSHPFLNYFNIFKLREHKAYVT